MATPFAAQRLFAMCERINAGALRLHTPEGELHSFGDANSAGGLEAEITIRDWAALSAVIKRGDVGLGEAYVQGLWDSPDVEKLLSLLLANEHVIDLMSGGTLMHRLAFRFINAIWRRNNRSGSMRNIQAHYDVGNEFYKLWLDDSMTYSSALYGNGAATLEAAQQDKYARLLSELPGDAEQLLEIGCGWGGFAERAAGEGRCVTGLTVSRAQHDFATRRLGAAADIKLQDYRDAGGKFDAIVSIEMIEAVGERYWPDYFRTLKARLADGGRAALQVILVEDASFDQYRRQSDFIRQYTFPGGMLVPPAKIEECANAAGLLVDSVYRFGQDYARTLREWRVRFDGAEKKIRSLGYGEEFLRSWRYYFDFCAAGFTQGRHINVAQIRLSHQ